MLDKEDVSTAKEIAKVLRESKVDELVVAGNLITVLLAEREQQRPSRSDMTWVDATTWRGLTDDEIDEGLLRSDYALQTAHAWRAGVVFAMAKLKEKNK